jgi:phage terminase small subunit
MARNTGEMTEKELRFVEEYLVDLNSARAARAAGYSEASAANIAYQLLRKPRVKAAIEAAQRERSERTGVTADQVINELARIAFADIGAAFDEDGNLKPLHELPEDARRALSGVETDELFEGRGEERAKVGVVRKIKFWDKTRALELLARHFGVLGKQGESEGGITLIIRTDASAPFDA